MEDSSLVFFLRFMLNLVRLYFRNTGTPKQRLKVIQITERTSNNSFS